MPFKTVLISRACISSKVTVEHVHELGKGEQHVEGEPAHAGGGVERLGNRHERYSMLVE